MAIKTPSVLVKEGTPVPDRLLEDHVQVSIVPCRFDALNIASNVDTPILWPLKRRTSIVGWAKHVPLPLHSRCRAYASTTSRSLEKASVVSVFYKKPKTLFGQVYDHRCGIANIRQASIEVVRLVSQLDHPSSDLGKGRIVAGPGLVLHGSQGYPLALIERREYLLKRAWSLCQPPPALGLCLCRSLFRARLASLISLWECVAGLLCFAGDKPGKNNPLVPAASFLSCSWIFRTVCHDDASMCGGGDDARGALVLQSLRRRRNPRPNILLLAVMRAQLQHTMLAR